MDDIDYSFEGWLKVRDAREVDPIVEKWLEAAATGNAATVVDFLNSGIDINARDRWLGQTALFKAVTRSHLETIRVLLERGADLNYVDCLGYTALTHAIRRSLPIARIPSYVPDPEPLKLLKEAGARFNLIDAIWTNDLELARIRLEEGADPDHGEHSYFGPVLMEAARFGHVAMIDLLLDFGANLEATDDLSHTAIHAAATEGQTEAVSRLLDRGADIDDGWPYGSPLTMAAANGHYATMALLLSRGAKRAIIDALVLNDEAVLKGVIDEELRNSDDGRPFQSYSGGPHSLAILAARHANLPVLRLMLDHGAELVVFHQPHSLLAEAAIYGHLEIMKFLIERGADLEAVGSDGLTPLAWAIREGRDETARLLRGS